MFKRIGALLITAAFLGAGTASAATSARLTFNHPTRITFVQARQALLANGRNDDPQSVFVRGCHRLSPTRIRCHLLETAMPTLWTLDGQPLVADADWLMDASMRHGHVITSVV